MNGNVGKEFGSLSSGQLLQYAPKFIWTSRNMKHGKEKHGPRESATYVFMFHDLSFTLTSSCWSANFLRCQSFFLTVACRGSCSSAMLIQCRAFSIYNNEFFFVFHWPRVKCILAISSHLIKIHLRRKGRRRVKAFCLATDLKLHVCLLLKKIDFL